MLTYAASSVHPQDLTPSLSLLSFKPKTATFSLCSNLSVRGERKASKWVDVYTLRETKNCFCSHVVVASAVAAEAEVGTENVEETEGDDLATAAATATTVVTKPKKGKAALPLKRDRVRVFHFCWVSCEF